MFFLNFSLKIDTNEKSKQQTKIVSSNSYSKYKQ